MTVLGLALAGGLGALARYHLGGWLASRWPGPVPVPTLVVNVAGSGLLGLLVGSMQTGRLSAGLFAWAGTGFLGAFTTFSTFTYETVRLVEDGSWLYAGLNVVLSYGLAGAAAALGYLLTGVSVGS